MCFYVNQKSTFVCFSCLASSTRARVILCGCVFHWTQCVYRMVLRLGLNATYLAAGDTYAFIRKLLALPFLSAEHRSFPGSRYPLRPGRKRRGRQAGGVRGGHVSKWSNLETNGLVSLPRECPHEQRPGNSTIAESTGGSIEHISRSTSLYLCCGTRPGTSP